MQSHSREKIFLNGQEDLAKSQISVLTYNVQANRQMMSKPGLRGRIKA